MKTSIVCIAKNEDNYIKEWINYHLKLGFDDVFIYCNNWYYEDNRENVHTIQSNGERQQPLVYNLYYNDYKLLYDWISFLDVDEYIILKKHNNIKDFLSNYESYPSVGINWYLFGDNGQTKVTNDEYSLIKRFTKRELSVNPHIKSIINTKFNHSYIDTHCSTGDIIDPEFNMVSGPLHHNGTNSIAQINHYFCKTIEEFNFKINRGRATCNLLRNIDDFNFHNKNEVSDFTALNFMYKF